MLIRNFSLYFLVNTVYMTRNSDSRRNRETILKRYSQFLAFNTSTSTYTIASNKTQSTISWPSEPTTDNPTHTFRRGNWAEFHKTHILSKKLNQSNSSCLTKSRQSPHEHHLYQSKARIRRLIVLKRLKAYPRRGKWLDWWLFCLVVHRHIIKG